MGKLIISFVFLLISYTFAVGQDVTELAIIRSLLGVPQNTSIKSSNSVAVPKDVPLKLHIDVSGDTPERDKKVLDILIQWLDEWGKGNVANGIKLEMVNEPGQARVALIHYSDFPTEIVEPGGGGNIGPPSNTSTVKMSMMIYTYIIVIDSDSLKILYRRKDPIITRSTIVAGAYLTKAATDRLRNEIDKEIDNRAMKSRGEKDSKRPDSRLRDEFARWMASEDKSLKSQ
jgi:hypothetical protein